MHMTSSYGMQEHGCLSRLPPEVNAKHHAIRCHAHAHGQAHAQAQAHTQAQSQSTWTTASSIVAQQIW